MRRTRAMFTIRDISSLFRLWPMRDSPFCTRQFEVTYTSALSKYPELAIAYAGRAQCSLWKGQFKDATEDISRAIDINNNDPLYRDYFHALLYRCLQGTANMLKHKAHANEAMWSDVQKGKELAFHELERIVDRNSDWAARITLAECLLETNPERALTLLDAAWSDIEKELDVRSQCHEVLLNPESTEEIKLFVKSWFSQVDYSCNQNENSFQSATMKTAFKTLLNDLNQSVSLKDFAAKMKLEKLTTQELDAVLRVCAMVHVGELGFARPVECHVFPTKLWDGTAALVLRERMEQLSGNVTLKNQEKLNRLLGKIQSLDSEADSYNSKAAVELVKGMGKEKQSDLLATLFKDVGEPHSSAITKCDADFFELLKDIDQTYSTIPLGIPGSKVYLSEQKKLAMDFLWQQKDRIALAKAKCHIALKNDDLALELLSKIIKRDSYFSMFQVLEARAQLTKNMGHVELSDSDFKELSRLRVSSTDIPNFDNNRKIDNEF